MTDKHIYIDPRYEDVDFTKDPKYVYGAVQPSLFDLEGTCYEETIELLNDNQLRAAAEQQAAEGGGADFVTRIFDQQQEGSCVGNASGQGLECLQARALGISRVTPISPMSIYKSIARSAQSGAVVSDSMDQLLNVGALPLDTPENVAVYGNHVMSHTGFNQRYPDGWKDTASKFKLREVNVIRSFQGLLTALARQDPVVVGREGHSILYLGLIWDNGRWKVIYVNSWGRWGFAAGSMSTGFGVDSESQIKKSASWAYAMRDITLGGV